MKKSLLKGTAIVLALFTGSIGLTACNSKTAGSSQTSTNSTSSTSSTATSAPVNLTIAYTLFGSTPSDQKLVQDALSKLTQQKINCTVTLLDINGSSYGQQVGLMLASSQKLDLMTDGGITNVFDYTGHVAKGQLYPLDDLLDKYGSDVKSAVGSFMDAAKINGKIYGVPTVRDFAMDQRLMMRKDLVDKYHIDVSKIKTTDDVEKVLAIIKKNEPTITPLLPGANAQGSVYLNFGFDGSGDYLGDYLGVLEDMDTLKVTDMYESAKYKQYAELARKWYKAGYLLVDTSANTENGTQYVKAGKLFAYIESGKPGIEAQDSKTAGTELVSATLDTPYSTTGTVTGFMWAIPNYAKHPVQSMQFLNLMYGDPSIINMLDFGIEGKDYVKVSGQDNMIEYPSGVTDNTAGYNIGMGFQFGDQLKSYLWKGNSPTLWDDMQKFNASAHKSKAFGFAFDATSVKTQYADLQNVVSQYNTAISLGSVDPDTQIPAFIAKLKAAGIDDVVKEKQAQLDKWAAANGVK